MIDNDLHGNHKVSHGWTEAQRSEEKLCKIATYCERSADWPTQPLGRLLQHGLLHYFSRALRQWLAERV